MIGEFKMKRLINILLALIGTLLVLLVVALVALVYLVNPNDYKPQITQLVKDTTGRTLTLEGEIQLRVFPWLELKLDQVYLSNAPGFKEPYFAQVEQAQVRVRVLPLLYQRLEVGTVSLTGLVLNLTRNAEGKTNWEDLMGETTEPSEPITLDDLKIKGLNVKNAQISWDDQLAGSRYVFSGVDLTTAGLVQDKPVPFHLKTQLALTGATSLQGLVDLKTQLVFNLSQQRYQLQALQLTTDLTGESVPGGQQSLALATDVKLDLLEDILTFEAIDLQALGTILNGTITARGLQTTPHLAGQVQLAEFNLQQALTQFAVPPFVGDHLLQKVALTTKFETNFTAFNFDDVNLRVDDNQLITPNFQFDLAQETLDAKTLELKLAGAPLSGSLAIERLLSQPIFQGNLTMAQVDPRAVLQRLASAKIGVPAITMPDSPVLPLKQMALSGDFLVNSATGVQLDHLQLQADDKQLHTEQVKIDFLQQRLAIPSFTLQAYGLDLTSQVNIEQLFTQPVIKGALAVAPFNPRQLLAQLTTALQLPALSLPATNILPLQTAKLTTEFQLTDNNQLIIDDFLIQVDKNKLTTPRLQLDLTQEMLKPTDFSLNALGITLQGQVTTTHLFNQPTTQAKLTIAPFNPQQLLQQLGQAPLTLPKPFSLKKAALETDLQVTPEAVVAKNLYLAVDQQQFKTTALRFDLINNTLTLDSFIMRLLDVMMMGKVTVTQVTTKPNWQGSIKTMSFNPKTVLQQLAVPLPVMADKKAFTDMLLETEVKGDVSQLQLNPLKLHLDDTQLQGEFQVQDFQTLAMAFNLNIDQLDVDRYLPPKPTIETPTEKPIPTPETPLPLDLLKTLNLNGQLTIGQLKAAQLKMSDVHLVVTAKDGHLTITPRAALYNGTYRGNLTLNTHLQPPLLEIDDTLNHIHASPLLLDLTGDDKLIGIAHITARLTSDATSIESLQKQLQGNIRFLFLDGALKGFNIGYTIRKTKAYLMGEPLPPPEPIRTDFTSLEGTLFAKAGIMTSDDLVMKSPLLRINGNGKMDLATQEIDFEVKTAVVDTAQGQGGQALKELKGVVIPLKIAGKMDAPSIKPDLATMQMVLVKLTEEAAKNQLEVEKQKLLEQNKDKIDKSLMDLLKGWKIEDLF
jgi:uncharacterized protein involved in outer membrane biogenesis